MNLAYKTFHERYVEWNKIMGPSWAPLLAAVDVNVREQIKLTEELVEKLKPDYRLAHPIQLTFSDRRPEFVGELI